MIFVALSVFRNAAKPHGFAPLPHTRTSMQPLRSARSRPVDRHRENAPSAGRFCKLLLQNEPQGPHWQVAPAEIPSSADRTPRPSLATSESGKAPSRRPFRKTIRRATDPFRPHASPRHLLRGQQPTDRLDVERMLHGMYHGLQLVRVRTFVGEMPAGR